MSRILKNLTFIIAVGSGLVGLPYGVSEVLRNNLLFGGGIVAATVLILFFSFRAAAYFHNLGVDVTIPGLVGGLLVFVGGYYLIIVSGPEDLAPFLKGFILVFLILLVVSYLLHKNHVKPES